MNCAFCGRDVVSRCRNPEDMGGGDAVCHEKLPAVIAFMERIVAPKIDECEFCGEQVAPQDECECGGDL